MPKGQQRSNREKKKSKQPKNTKGPASPFPSTQTKTGIPVPGSKT